MATTEQTQDLRYDMTRRKGLQACDVVIKACESLTLTHEYYSKGMSCACWHVWELV
ncbi:putative cell division control protein 6-like protein B [Sesbania bispinosa]|nr:putative cell division control protein 6-like protein B [Sesbania bispinosa]